MELSLKVKFWMYQMKSQASCGPELWLVLKKRVMGRNSRILGVWFEKKSPHRSKPLSLIVS